MRAETACSVRTWLASECANYLQAATFVISPQVLRQQHALLWPDASGFGEPTHLSGAIIDTVPSSPPPPRPPHSLPRQRGKHRRAFAFAFAILPQRQTDRKRNARPNTKLNARPAVARPVIAVAIDQSKRSQSLTSLHVRRAYTQRAYTSLTSRNGHQGPEHMETPRLNTESPRLPCVEPPGDSRVGSVFAISAGQGGRRRTRMPR